MLIRELQPATDWDLARTLLVIQHAAYRVEASLIEDDRIPPLHEDVNDLCRAPLVWLGALVEDQVVGAIAWRETTDSVDIDRLLVLTNAHRAGIGTALVREVLRRAGARRTTVSTGRANTPAKALYERLEFSLVEDREVISGLWVCEYVHAATLLDSRT